MGIQVEGFDVYELIHENEYSQIYRARRQYDQIAVSIKVLLSHLSLAQRNQRLMNEFTFLNELDSKNIVRAIDLISYGETFILVLEPLPSETLACYIKKEVLNLESNLEIALQVAQGLVDIHEKEIVHRRFNPRNVFIDKEGMIKIIDFGLASFCMDDVLKPSKLEKMSELVLYRSPEQVMRMEFPIDFLSDIYSLGVTLYQLFTGMLPYSADSIEKLYQYYKDQNPPPPHVVNAKIPKRLSHLIMKCIEKNPNDRYRDSKLILQELEELIHQIREPDSLSEKGVLELEQGKMSSFEVDPLHFHSFAQSNEIENSEIVEKLQEAEKEIHFLHEQLIQKDKLASLGMLTASIAHELKNPLNFIINYGQLANQSMEEFRTSIKEIDEKKREELMNICDDMVENLEAISTHGSRASNIIKGMLAHSHHGSNEMESININSLIENAVELAYHAFQKKEPLFNVNFKTNFDSKIKPIKGLSGELIRVFINLTDNSCYALSKKLKKIQFTPLIEIETIANEESVTVIYKDNGLGISKEDVKKVFAPFYTTKSSGAGTGLGLSITNDIIVNQHHGSISVDSVEGEFTQFTINLPYGPVEENQK